MTYRRTGPDSRGDRPGNPYCAWLPRLTSIEVLERVCQVRPNKDGV
jgi:hypothetical protein